LAYDRSSPEVPALPAERLARPQWAAWRYEPAEPKKKVPVNRRTGRHASPTDLGTWGTFEEACEARDRLSLDGIGFVLSADDPYAGVDLDHCRDPATGTVAPWAREMITALNSYTEVPPPVRVFISSPGASSRLGGGGKVPSKSMILVVSSP
jgi:putative DNA primase/helicase